MKNILPLLLLFLFTSCGIAQVEQAPLFKTNATVHSIIGDQANLVVSSELSFTVPAGTLEANKEYVFWLDVTGCHTCKNRKAIVAGAHYTGGQIQRDQAATAKELSNRKIIRH